MEQLRSCMTRAGYINVKTYIQSGNIVFETKELSKLKMTFAIEQLLLSEYGYTVTVFILDINDITKVIESNPYAGKENIETGPKKLYVTLLSQIPNEESIEKLKSVPIGNDEIAFVDNILYFKLANKASDSKLSNAIIENKLKVKATTRNWNTMIKMFSMIESMRC